MFSTLSKRWADFGLHASEIGLLIFAAIILGGLYGEYRKKARWKGLSDFFELLVVIGVAGELVFDGLIFGFSGRLEVLQDAAVVAAQGEAANAYEQARKANLQAVAANIGAETASKSADFANGAAAEAFRGAKDAALRAVDAADKAAEATDENTSLRQQVASQQGAIALLTNQNGVLLAANIKQQNDLLALKKEQRQSASVVGNIAKQTQGRSISENQRDAVLRGINGHRRPIVVVLLDDRESRAYGLGIAGILSEAHYIVHHVDFGHTSPLTGVIVCDNGFHPIKLFQALSKAGIATSFRRSTAEYDVNRPAECQAPSMFSNVPANAYRIFVGQRE